MQKGKTHKIEFYHVCSQGVEQQSDGGVTFVYDLCVIAILVTDLDLWSGKLMSITFACTHTHGMYSQSQVGVNFHTWFPTVNHWFRMNTT